MVYYMFIIRFWRKMPVWQCPFVLRQMAYLESLATHLVAILILAKL